MFSTFTLALLLSVIDVQGDAVCPSASEVERALQSLQAGETGSARRVAQVAEAPGGVVLTLRRPTGELLASRRVLTRAECSQRATALAVVLAAWEAELAGAPQQAQVLPPPPAWRWRLGAEAMLGLTDHSGPRFLPMGVVVGQIWREDSPWGWLGRLGASWPASSALASADVVWMRPLLSVEAGPWLQLAQPLGAPLQAELAAGISVLRLWGEGFAVNESSSGMDLSLSTGLRWLLASGTLRPELSLGATFWLIPQQVRVVGASEGRVLPQWELRAGIGFLWGP